VEEVAEGTDEIDAPDKRKIGYHQVKEQLIQLHLVYPKRELLVRERGTITTG
jgi:hypothetical protein